MSAQKSKKGFTLIELMVVIIIIGILAAIAIPKIFGMNAKAKAQEVGPAVGTWAKLQQAYKMEKGSWGGGKQISYKLPGDKPEEKTSSTTNFEYTISDINAEKVETASLTAKNLFGTKYCLDSKGLWKGEFTSTASKDPETTVSENCKALTPNFENIGGGGGSSS